MTKICTKCKESKDVSEFSFIQARNRLASWCKHCSTASRMLKYYENPDAHREYQKQRAIQIRLFVELARTPCIFCQETERVCLDFHHRDPSQKDFALARCGDYSIERVQEELAKCVSVCSNCHRKLHAGLLDLPA